MVQILTSVAVLLSIAVVVAPSSPARAQDDAAARALEAEIEQERREEEAAAAALHEATDVPLEPVGDVTAVESIDPDPPDPAPVGDSPPVAATMWDRDLDDGLRQHGVAAEWSAAWQKLDRDEAFRESSCFPSQAALVASAGERIRHRRIAREDFRARRKSRDAKLAVAMKHSVTEAHVLTSIVCIGRLRAEQVTPGRFAVWFDDLEYVALLDPNGSWWNPKAKTHPDWLLRHEQLHFDVTELVARRQNAERLRHARALQVVADSPEAAMNGFARRWSEHFRSILAEWMALQQQYDRETRHGTLPKQQTAWFSRVHREMAALSAAAR